MAEPEAPALKPGTALVAAVGDDALIAAVPLGRRLPAGVEWLVDTAPGEALRAATLSWARAGGTGHGALALLARPGIGKTPAGSIALRSRTTALRCPVTPVDAPTLAALVKADAGAGFPALIDGIVEALLASNPGPAAIAAAAALVEAASEPAGFIEIAGRPSGGGCFLQGWTLDLTPGRLRVIALAETPVLADLYVAGFEREDLGGHGVGFAATVEPSGGGGSLNPVALLYRASAGWRRIQRYERCVTLAPAEVPGHARTALAKAKAPPEVLRRLTAAAQRFEGRDTVTGLKEPVRIGVDFACRVDGAGVLVAGWLLDPDRRVEAVRLSDAAGSVAVSAGWTRLARPDVTAAFAADAVFRGLDPGRHGHGFIAFAPGIGADPETHGIHVELALRSGAPAFYPLNPTPMGGRQALAKAIGSIDPRAGFTLRAAEQQFAPLLQAVRPQARRAADVLDIGFDDAAPLALVVGCDQMLGEAKTLLALLALDPETRGMPIVLAGPAESFMQAGGDIRRLAAFYGLKLRLAPADGVEDVFDAIEAGITACHAPDLLVLSGHLLPKEKGWVGLLERAYRQKRGAAISPTILYEDGSVRWAGMEFVEGPRGRVLEGPRLGYRRPERLAGRVVATAAATPECCLLPRAAFVAAGGFGRSYLGTIEKGTDFALRLRLAGTPAWWLPEAEMIGAEEAGATLPNAWQLTRRIDRLAFDRRLSLAVANLGT